MLRAVASAGLPLSHKAKLRLILLVFRAKSGFGSVDGGSGSRFQRRDAPVVGHALEKHLAQAQAQKDPHAVRFRRVERGAGVDESDEVIWRPCAVVRVGIGFFPRQLHHVRVDVQGLAKFERGRPEIENKRMMDMNVLQSDQYHKTFKEGIYREKKSHWKAV